MLLLCVFEGCRLVCQQLTVAAIGCELPLARIGINVSESEA